MGNMSYCRFQNTLRDMNDCLEHAADDDLSIDEQNARTRLVSVCQSFIDEANED